MTKIIEAVRQIRGEAHEAVQVWCGDLVVRIVGLDVPDAKVIGEDDDDVGRSVGGAAEGGG